MNNAECVGSNDTRLRHLALLLSAVFLSRLLFAIMVWRTGGALVFFSPDTGSYVAPAQSLLGGCFSSNGVPEIFRTPGYPFLLALSLASEHFVLFSVFENLMLSVATAWLIWRIMINLSPDPKAAVWAVLLYCLEPVGFLYSEKILSETAFCAQFLLFVYLFVRFLQKPTYVRLMLSALALGCATYTRPVSLYLGFWLAPILCFLPRSLTRRERVMRAALFPLVFALTLAPWVIRNAKVADYAGLSSVSDYNLYFYSGAAVRAKIAHKSFSQVQQELGWANPERYFELHPEQRGWPQGKVARFERKEAERLILTHLPQYSLIHLRGSAIVVLDPGITELLKMMRRYPESGGLLSRAADQGMFRATLWLIQQYPVAAIGLPLLGLQLLLYYALAIRGVSRLPCETRVWYAWFFLYFVLVSGGPAAVARFRAPLMGLVCIAAGVALASKRRKGVPGTQAQPAETARA